MRSFKERMGWVCVGAVVSAVLAVAGLCMWETSGYVNDMPPYQKGVWYGYDSVSVTGLILFSTFATLAVGLLYVASQQFSKHALTVEERQPRLIYAALASHAALGVAFFALGILGAVTWGADPLKCGVIFCVGADKYAEPSNGRPINGASVNAGIGMMACFSLCPFALVMLFRTAVQWRQLSSSRGNQYRVDNRERGGATMRLYRRTAWYWQVLRVLCALVVLFFFMVITFYLPNDTRRFVASKISSAAASAPSDTNNPEVPGAVFRTHTIKLSDDLFIKVFPGNLFFYVYLMLLVLIIGTTRLTHGGRYVLQRRLRFLPSFSIGEVIVSVLTVALIVLFCFYWGHDHNYKKFWNPNKASTGYIQAAEFWGRATGQFAVLFLSLLMFPISRQSVLNDLLGVSWESMLWMHRVLGWLMLAATVAHVIAFGVSFQQLGRLLHNTLYLPTYCSKKNIVNDFTLVVAFWSTWLLLIAMGVLALNRFRRGSFEVFYYAHLVASFSILPVVLWHAAAGWEYMLPGMTVWIVDRFVRLFQSSSRVTVTRTRVVGDDVVEVAFTVERWGLRSVHPGQYVMLNVPEVSTLQWHPFTLSNAVPHCDDVADCDGKAYSTEFMTHIKTMGPGTWTQKIYDRVAAGRAITLGVEGPYGEARVLEEYDEIFLVAGGIGVTPCASIMGTLLRYCEDHKPKRVRLIWSVRSAELVGSLIEQFGLPAAWKQLTNEAKGPQLNSSGADHSEDTGDVSDSARSDSLEGKDSKKLEDDVPAMVEPDDVVETRATVGDVLRDDVMVPEGTVSSSDPSLKEAQLSESQEPSATTGGLAASAEEQAASSSPAGVSQTDAARVIRLSGGARGSCQQFESRIFVTREDAFSAIRRVHEHGGMPAGAASCATEAHRVHHDHAEISVEVHGKRPDIAKELLPAFADRECTWPYPSSASRTLIVTCGPEALTEMVVRRGAELGVIVHKEEFLF